MVNDVQEFTQSSIIEEFRGLTPGETEAHETFSRLVAETSRQFSVQKKHVGFIRPYDGTTMIHQCRAIVSADLIEGWDTWERNYPALVARNPRLELRDLLQEMSEAFEGASWPYMAEWVIERWVADGGSPRNAPYPAQEHHIQRLKRLHAQLGGWVYSDDARQIMVFANTDEFREINVRMNDERRKIIEKEKRKATERLENISTNLEKTYVVPEGANCVIDTNSGEVLIYKDGVLISKLAPKA